MSNLNNLDSIDLALKEKIETGEFTPETLAWTLLTDDECENIKNGKILFFSNESSLNLEEQTENKFQILLTIYFELIFGWYKLLHLMKNEMNRTEDEFKPDLTKITLDDLTKDFVDKIKTLGFILYVKELDNENYEIERKKCYCKVLLKDLESNSKYFYLKRYQLDTDKRYTFVRNANFELNTNIKKYTAVVKLPNNSFKIYFDFI